MRLPPFRLLLASDLTDWTGGTSSESAVEADRSQQRPSGLDRILENVCVCVRVRLFEKQERKKWEDKG